MHLSAFCVWMSNYNESHMPTLEDGAYGFSKE